MKPNEQEISVLKTVRLEGPLSESALRERGYRTTVIIVCVENRWLSYNKKRTRLELTNAGILALATRGNR